MAKSSYSIAVDVELRAQAKSVDSFIKGLEQRVTDANISDRLFNISGNTINKMRKELDKANELLTHDTLSGFEAGQLEKSFRTIEKLYNNLFDTFKKSGYKELGFDDIVTKQFEDATDKIKKVQKQKEKTISSTKTKDRLDANTLSKASQFRVFDQDANLSQNISLLVEESKAVDQLKEKYGSLSDVRQKAAASQQALNDVDNEIARFKTSTSYKQYSRVQSAEKFGTLTRKKGDTYKSSFDQIQSWFKDAVESYGGLGDPTQANNLAGQIFLSVMGFDQQLDSATINQYAQMNVDQVVQAFNTKVSELLSKQGNQRNKVGDLLNNQLFGQDGFKKQAETYVTKNRPQISGAAKTLSDLEDKRSQASEDYANLTDVENRIATAEANLSEVVTSLIVSLANLRQEVDKTFEAEEKKARQEFDDLSETEKAKQAAGILGGGPNATPATPAKKEVGSRISGGILRQQQDDEAENFKKNLQQSIKQWMSVREVIGLVKNGIRQAYQDIQGLDKAMTNIAVVTDFSVSDLWGKINEYMSIAQQYGVTTQGVYEVSQLYFQQGLGEADTMAATVETLKMARIAGMDYAEAADGMTVAIRGFNMEMTDAAHVTDVYSKVAAITASDTQELVTAMSKTASSAAAVGSSFENTTAMLAVMIEATRESPQNLGSALKSIISRYGEMTKGLTEDSEGEEIDYNRVDTALKTVGISLKDAQGQFRDFDTVIEELSAKWDTLDSVTQRYIATIFAGNRQQSRFLALVSNYDRYMEVSEAAANSEDAGLLQYSKTLDSLETKLNNIKTSFQQFYMSIFDGPTVGAVLDFVNNLIKGFNKLGKISSVLNIGSIIGAIKVIGTIIVSDFAGAFSQISGAWKATLKQMTGDAGIAGTEAGSNYTTGFNSKNTGSNTLSLKGSKIATGAMLVGSALTLGGSALASKNQFDGALLSLAGNALSIGFQLAMINPLLGIIGGVVAGLVTLVTSLPDSNAKALEKLEKIKAETEEKNIKRAETKEDYNSLKNGIEKIEELNKIKYDSDENYQAWIEANNSLIEAYPSMLGYIDEAGNSIADLSNSTEMLSASMQKAAEANRDYYISKVNEIQTGIDNNRYYAFKNNSADSTFMQEIWAGFIDYWINPNYANPDAKSYNFHLKDGTELGWGDNISVEVLKNNFDLAGIDLFQKLREINASTEEQLSSDMNFQLLKELGAIIKDDNGLWNFHESLEGYLTAEKQLQELYSTKQAAMQSGINLASLQSELDDSVASIEGYTSLIIELGKIHPDFENFSYIDLANLSVEAYEEIARPFIDLYESLNSSKQKDLSLLGGQLTSLSFSELKTTLEKDFGVIEGDTSTGGIYEAYINQWKQQNYSAQQKILNSLWNFDIASFGEWKEGKDDDFKQLSLDEQKNQYNLWIQEQTAQLYENFAFFENLPILGDLLKEETPFNKKWVEQYAPELIEAHSEEQIDAYDEWIQDQITLILDQKTYLFDLIFDQTEDGNYELAISSNIASKITEFNAQQEEIITESTNILIEEAARARQEFLVRALAEAGNIQFTGDWKNSENLQNISDMFGIDFSKWLKEDVISFINLLSATNAGDTDWQKDLDSLAKEYGQVIDWSSSSLSALLYTSFNTQIKSVVDKTTDISESMTKLQNSQEKGFDWEESLKLLKTLGKEESAWNTIFEYNEEGLLVLKDFNETLKELYDSQIGDLNSFAQEISDFKTAEGKTESLADFLANGPYDPSDKSQQKNLIESLTSETGLFGLSEGMANDIVTWASSAESITEESLNQFLAELFGNAEAAAEYLTQIKDNILKQTSFDKYVKDTYGKLQTTQEILNGPTLENLKDYGITNKLIGIDDKGNYDWASYFSSLSESGFNIDEFGNVSVTDAQAAVSKLTGKAIENFGDAEKLLVDLFTQNAEETLSTIQKEMMGLAETLASGENIDSSDVRSVFSNFLGDATNEQWTALTTAIINKNYEDFKEAVKAIKPTIKDDQIAVMWSDYGRGFTLGTQQYTESVLDGYLKIMEDSFTSADLAELEEGPLKEALKKFQKNINEQLSTYIETILGSDLNFDEKVSSIASGYEANFNKQFGYETSIAESLTSKEALSRSAAAKMMAELKVLGIKTEGSFIQNAEGTGLFLQNSSQILDAINEKVEAEINTLEELYYTGEISQKEYATRKRAIEQSTLGQTQKQVQYITGWQQKTLSESLMSNMEALSTATEISAKDIFDSYKELTGLELDATTAQEWADIFEALDPMERLARFAEWAETANIEIDQNKYQQIVSAILDSILESISSGISSLGAGLEGTLGAADYQALVTKYDLSGNAYRTSKGLQLSNADQQKLISQMFIEAQNAGLESDFGEQIWEVYRDSQEDAIDGYTAIEEEIARVKSEHKELTGEALAYVKALQQARYAAMFDEDSVEFAFMEQDATDGLTKNFDKFVDNIDKAKDAFSAFKSGEAIGYQDFYNMMDFMNKFGANGETNSFIKEIEKAGYTYEDFVNTVVAKTDEFGKVDISGVAAEMGISVDAAMKGMAAGMAEGLQQVAQQQIKYLSSLEAMLEALLILESIGSIEFGLSFEIDLNGDGNPESINGWLDLIEKFEKLSPDQQKKAIVLLEAKFKDMGEGYHNIFKAIWGDGDADFLDKAFASVLDNETYFKAIQTQIKDGNSIIAQIFSKAAQGETFGQGVAEAVLSAFDVSGFKWEEVFNWKEGSITGWSDSFLKAINKDELSGADLMGYIWGTLLGLDPNTISESFTTALSGKEITLDNQTYKISAEKGKYIVHGLDGTKIDLDGEAGEKIKQQIESYIGEQITNLSIDKDGNLTFELLKNLEKQTVDGGETPVEINPQWKLADGSAGTLTQTLQEQSSAPITIDVPVVINPIQYDITEIQEKIETLGKDSPFIAAWQNTLNTLKNVVPISATADITWDAVIVSTSEVASMILNSIDQFITIPFLATPKIVWAEPTQSGVTPQEKINLIINGITVPNIDRDVVASLGLDTEKSTVNITGEQLSALVDQKIEEIKNIENKESTEANKIIDLGKEFDVLISIGKVIGLNPAEVIQQWKKEQAEKETNTVKGQQGIDLEVDVNNILVNSIATVTGLTAEQIQSALGENYTINNLAVLASVILGLGSGENGQSSIEDTGFIQAIIDYVNGRAAEPVTVQTTATVDTTNENIDEGPLATKIQEFAFTPVDITIPVVVKTSIHDNNAFNEELKKYTETYFDPNEDINLENFMEDPLTKAFGKTMGFDLSPEFAQETFDKIKNILKSNVMPDQSIIDATMGTYFSGFETEANKIETILAELPQVLSTINTSIDVTAFSEMASYLSQAATSAEALKDALTVIGGLTLGGLAGASENSQQEGLEGQAENLQTVSGELTNINSLGDPLQQTTQGATLANVPLLEIIYSLINTVTQLNQIKSNEGMETLKTTTDETKNSMLTLDGVVEQLRNTLQLLFSPDANGNTLMSALLGTTSEDGQTGITGLLEQLSSGLSQIDASGISNVASSITSIATQAESAKSALEGLFDFLAKLGNGKKATKIEIDKDSAETFKETSEAAQEIPEEVKTEVTQDGAEETQSALENVKSAEEEVENSDPHVSTTEYGADEVVIPALGRVTDAANSVPDVTISVTVTGVEEALGQINKLKAGANGGGKWRGSVNSVHYSGRALAGGNVGKLNAGAKLANKTLVGELGPELAVYDGQYHLLGSGGAEFVKLPKNALVFNHLQTRGIINGQMNGARAKIYDGRAQNIQERMWGSAMATGNVSGPALASGIGGALEAVRRAKSVWQGLLNSLSAADLLGGGGGGGGGGGNDESLKAHIEDLQEWYNLSRKIADIEQQINTLLAKRENITDGHEYLKNLRATQALLEDQVNTQTDLMRFQEKQLKAQADFINNHDIWSKFLNVDENGLLQYNEGNETNGGKGALKVLQELNEMSGSQQLKYITKTLGWSYTNTDGEELEDEELVAKFFEELQKQIDDYDALHDTVAETTEKLEELETEINEIEKEIRENEIDLSQEIYDIIVDAWKENIENLKEQNELIKKANDAYAEGIQKALDAEKEQYEENRSIEEREQLQRQLSLLRRSGGSASEIADLEQQLDETLKDEYFRNQEQALEKIRDANERQVELMEQQVKIQEDSLAYQQEQGVIWQKVYEVMQGTDAEILDFMQGNSTEFFEKSSLVQQDMLTEWAKMIGIYNEEKVRDYYTAQAEENINQAWDTERGKGLKDVYDSASKKDRDNWNREYYEQYAKAMMEGATETEALTKAQEELYEHLEEYKKAMEEKAEEEKKKKSGGGGGSSSGGSSNKPKLYTVTVDNGDGTTSNYSVRSSGSKSSIQNYLANQVVKNNKAVVKSSNAGTKEVQKKVDEKNKKKNGLLFSGTANSIGPARYNGTLVGEFGMELGVWNDKWHLMGKNGPEMRNDIPSDALIFNHLQTAGILQGQYSSDFFSRKLSDIPNQLNDSYNSAISGITNNSDSSNLTIEPGAVVVQVQQLNDRYDIDELYNDITDRIYAIASQSSGRGVSRR